MKDKKFLCFDIESTGLIPGYHEIHQLSGIICYGNEEVDSFEFNVKPEHDDRISEDALAICGITKDHFLFSMPMKDLHPRLIMKVADHIDRYNKDDKLVLVGQNCIKFDTPHLEALFGYANDKYFGSFFDRRQFDTLRVAHALHCAGVLDLENFKLETLCKTFGVKLSDAHDSTADCRATWEIAKILMGLLKKLKPDVDSILAGGDD